MKRVNFLGPLLIILIILKLIGFINWHWLIVLSPLWLVIIIVFVGNIINLKNKNKF